MHKWHVCIPSDGLQFFLLLHCVERIWGAIKKIKNIFNLLYARTVPRIFPQLNFIIIKTPLWCECWHRRDRDQRKIGMSTREFDDDEKKDWRWADGIKKHNIKCLLMGSPIQSASSDCSHSEINTLIGSSSFFLLLSITLKNLCLCDSINFCFICSLLFVTAAVFFRCFSPAPDHCDETTKKLTASRSEQMGRNFY